MEGSSKQSVRSIASFELTSKIQRRMDGTCSSNSATRWHQCCGQLSLTLSLHLLLMNTWTAKPVTLPVMDDNHTTCHVYTNFSEFSPRASRRSHHPCLMIPAAWWKRTSTKPKSSMLFSSDRLPSRHSMENLHQSMQRLLQRTANYLCPSRSLSRMWSVPYVCWMLEKHQALTAFQHVSLLFLRQDPPPPWFEFLVIFDFFAPWYRKCREASSVKISWKNSNEKLVKCATEVGRLHKVSIQSCTQNRPSPKVQSLTRDWI